MRHATTALAVFLGLALGAAARADDVLLRNGSSFEGVLAEWQGDALVIRMPGGEMRLARSAISEVVTKGGVDAEYLRRATDLRRSAPQAADWFALARWAQVRGLPSAVREASLKAASLDPDLAGLPPLMEALGYARDGERGAWIPYEDSMRRRGFVYADGEWIPRSEAAARGRAAEEAEAARRAASETARVERATEQARLEAADLELQRARAAAAAPVVEAIYPVFILSGYFPPPNRCDPGGCEPRRKPREDFRLRDGVPVLDFAVRQPGSLFLGEW